MYIDKKILAVIPARGGSKGVPGKNIKELHGHPLIAYTISEARASSYIDDVVVTTDSYDIAAVSRRYGARVPFMRPAELSSDTAKSIDVLVHAVKSLEDMGERYDTIVFLQPTSPLRRSIEIDEAIKAFFNHGEMGLVSVSQVAENPILTRRFDGFGILHPLLPVSSTVRRQDMPLFYHVDGAIYINKVSDISLSLSLNDNPIGYEMPKNRSLDIDEIEDFMRAEEIMQRLDDAEPHIVNQDYGME
ncbi:cytidylyltransferase domain-containing protein [Enorma phocaeensis]|uniref:Acylneuraminate cytidylyltransferase family protein n=1 Tax=Enorma phocaeensis TaxID=1871019 RepID=A0ABT7V6P9_9ACTN|nr:acylneuraminate cytidylyltransferase family protein [Enorma phocaeensis]MDM8274168.1 acylneuraminate cytidylyltransferase family protein [Enorma phocaeensis]